MQFGAKALVNTPVPNKTNTETESDQTVAEPTNIPEDITAFYDKIDKEDEDEEEDQELRTVSFEVNQVCILMSLNIFNIIFVYVRYSIYIKIMHSTIRWKGKN